MLAPALNFLQDPDLSDYEEVRNIATAVSPELANELPFLRLVARLRELSSVAVAFSGGVDSSFLAYVGRRILGRDRCQALTAVSDSLGSDEAAHCQRLADRWDLQFSFIETAEMRNANYVANDRDRCYWCKVELMQAAQAVIDTSEFVVALGVNLDDLGDHRPGQRAAREAGAVFPLVDAGYSKDLIRHHSKVLGLETWDRPQAACLASRIPYGTEVSVGVLSRVERTERALKRLGFRQVRVRHYEDTARIELSTDDFSAAIAKRQEIVSAAKAAGYDYITLDLEGFRSGNLNS